MVAPALRPTRKHLRIGTLFLLVPYICLFLAQTAITVIFQLVPFTTKESFIVKETTTFAQEQKANLLEREEVNLTV